MRVVARKGAYTGAAESGPTMTVIEPKPRLESAPAIVGEPYIGETVSSTAGVWFEATKWERSWQLCDDAACGAYAPAGTDAVFTPNATMRGKWLRLRVTARNTHPSHATEAFSPIVGPVGDRPVVVPPEDGGGQQGGGQQNGGGEQGGGGRPGGGAPKPPVARPTARAPFEVTFVGRRVRVGTTLKLRGRAAGHTSVRRQWLRGTTPIRRATGAAYRVTRADRGRRLSCRVTLIGPGGRLVVRTTPVSVR